jgi:hypothetical protein
MNRQATDQAQWQALGNLRIAPTRIGRVIFLGPDVARIRFSHERSQFVKWMALAKDQTAPSPAQIGIDGTITNKNANRLSLAPTTTTPIENSDWNLTLSQRRSKRLVIRQAQVTLNH